MKDYIFVLGRNLELSLLELLSYLKNLSMQPKFTLVDNFVLMSLNKFDPKKAMKCLGGTVKIAEELKGDIYNGSKNKITFAINWCKSDPLQITKKIKALFKEIDVKATQRFVKSRLVVPSKGVNLDVELVAFRNKLFTVVASSNPKVYKDRDENRPVFSPLKVTSIRLAKMLINLAQPKKEILDPFCGTGTVLQEALLMGLKVKGVDRQVSDVNKNLRWLQKKFPNIKNKWKVVQGDAARVSKRFSSVECVVSEPFLGPFYKKPPLFRDAIITARKLEELYLRTLKELARIVKGKVVLLIPQWRTKERKIVNINITKLLKDSGFRVYIPSSQVKVPLLYDDTKNNVQRLVFILEKV